MYDPPPLIRIGKLPPDVPEAYRRGGSWCWSCQIFNCHTKAYGFDSQHTALRGALQHLGDAFERHARWLDWARKMEAAA
ncbi:MULTISPECIES: hypothetical protein [unclassified Streptomyces]|uniref:hypothetical protein n=1 Tax=unclassified Streptomyces TaxID=2593676 RepID=UPI003410B52F